MSLAQDGKDLIEALALKDVAIGGWPIGGMAAQILLAIMGDQASHLILLATTPPDKLVKPGEQLFYDTAAIPCIDLDQFTTVFFEPADATSVEASKRSFADSGPIRPGIPISSRPPFRSITGHF